MMNKMNTFTDFISSAEHLVSLGYTSKDRWRSWAAAPAGC